MLIGIAISEGRIRSDDSTLASVRPRDGPGCRGCHARAGADDDRGIRRGRAVSPVRRGGGLDGHHGRDAPVAAAGTGVRLFEPRRAPALGNPRRCHQDVRSRLRTDQAVNPLGISTDPAEEPVSSVPDLPEYDARPGFGWAIDPQGLHLGMADLK
jgi:hypothetical protein